MPALESQLIISADDRTAAAFASVQEKLSGLESTMAAVGRVSGPVGQLSGAVDRLGNPFAANAATLEANSEAIARHTTIIDNAGAALKAAGGSLVVKMGEAMLAYEGMKVAAEGVGQAMAQAHERMRMDAAGMSPAEIEDADKLSSDLVQQYPSITQSDAMALARNARASFGSYETAKKLLPEIAQSYVIAQAAKPNADPEQIRQDYELLIKGLEIKGVTQDPAAFKKMMEGINKGINAFGDTLKTSDYYEMIKYARQAGITLSTDFMVGVAPAIAQRMRGSSAGRAFADFDAAIVGGNMEHSGFRELLSLGLLTEADVDRTKTGEIKGLKPGHQIAGADLAAVNQYEWEQKYLMPALTRNNIVTPEQISQHLSKFLSNKYAAQLGLIYATQQASIEKDLVMEREAHGGSSAKDFLARDPLLASKALSNTVTNLIAANTPSGNSIARIENVLTKGVQQLGEAARFGKEHDFFSDLKTDLRGLEGAVRLWPVCPGRARLRSERPARLTSRTLIGAKMRCAPTGKRRAARR